MQSVIHAGMVLLEAFFFTGWVGSIVVVVISGIEDLETIFKKDSSEPAPAVGGDHELR